MELNEYLIQCGHHELTSDHGRSPLTSRIAELINKKRDWRLMEKLREEWMEIESKKFNDSIRKEQI